jgi:threonine aldolase
MDPEVIEAHILKRTLHTPGTALLCVENTHNRAGGTVVPLETMRAYREICDRHVMRLHLDGARVFNAAVALGVEVSEIANYADSVSFCLSKGLGAPAGSMLCGSNTFIEKARQWRKRLGGGMRQSGILAACGIVSLSQSVGNLAEDHRRARALASGIQDVPGLTLDWNTIQTNMVLVRTEAPASEWLENLKTHNVWALDNSPHHVRFVLHSDIDDEKVNRAIEAIRTCAAAIA